MWACLAPGTLARQSRLRWAVLQPGGPWEFGLPLDWSAPWCSVLPGHSDGSHCKSCSLSMCVIIAVPKPALSLMSQDSWWQVTKIQLKPA